MTVFTPLSRGNTLTADLFPCLPGGMNEITTQTATGWAADSEQQASQSAAQLRSLGCDAYADQIGGRWYLMVPQPGRVAVAA